MNVNAKKLISYIRGQDDISNVINSLIGYLMSLDKIDDELVSWSYIIDKLIKFDLTIIRIVEENFEDSATRRLKSFGYLFNNCYEFINYECPISFIKEAPFNNTRVANINDYKVYMLARRTYLNEYESCKNRGGE